MFRGRFRGLKAAANPERQKQKQIPCGNGKKEDQRKCNNNGQYGGLSTTAAKCAAFGRDDGVWLRAFWHG